jgi:hypothetical protein
MIYYLAFSLLELLALRCYVWFEIPSLRRLVDAAGGGCGGSS